MSLDGALVPGELVVVEPGLIGTVEEVALDAVAVRLVFDPGAGGMG